MAGLGRSEDRIETRENVLYTHPKIAGIATVAMPEPRLGERACRTYRHNRAVEFKMSDQLGKEEWIVGLSAFACDVPLDMAVRNGDGIVQLITHS